MKRAIGLCLALLFTLLALAGCGADRRFTWKDGKLFEGSVAYSYLPVNWMYYEKMPIVGWTNDGERVCGSADGMVVKLKERLLQDMQNRPMIREDIELPDEVIDSDYTVEIFGAALDEAAADQFWKLFHMMSDSETEVSRSGIDMGERIGEFSFGYCRVPGLYRSFINAFVYSRDGELFISNALFGILDVNARKINEVKIEEDTPLYAFLSGSIGD